MSPQRAERHRTVCGLWVTLAERVRFPPLRMTRLRAPSAGRTRATQEHGGMVNSQARSHRAHCAGWTAGRVHPPCRTLTLKGRQSARPVITHTAAGDCQPRSAAGLRPVCRRGVWTHRPVRRSRRRDARATHAAAALRHDLASPWMRKILRDLPRITMHCIAESDARDVRRSTVPVHVLDSTPLTTMRWRASSWLQPHYGFMFALMNAISACRPSSPHSQSPS